MDIKNIDKSTYTEKYCNIICESTNFGEHGLNQLITEYAQDPVKHYLSNKYNEFFVDKKNHTYASKHKFTFDEMANYFNDIATKLGHRHKLIDFQKNDNYISLFYNNNNKDGIMNNINFIIKNDGLYLQPEHPKSIAWPYDSPSMLLNLYLGKIHRDNTGLNKLEHTDILFDHCL